MLLRRSILAGLLLLELSPWAPSAPLPQQGARFNLLYGGKKVSLKAPPPRDARLALHFQSLQRPCRLAVFEFAGNSARAAEGFQPRSWALEPGRENSYSLPARNGQLFVVVAAPGSASAKNLEDWIQKWNDQKSRTSLHTALTNWLNNQEAAALGRSGTVPPELGGVESTSAESAGAPPLPVLRSQTHRAPVVDWRRDSDWVVGDENRPGVFVYQVEVPSR